MRGCLGVLVEGQRTRHDALERGELTTFPAEELLASGWSASLNK